MTSIYQLEVCLPWGVGQRSPVQWQRGLIEPQLLVAVLQKLCPPPPVLFHLEASVWVECSSTQEAQWCEHGATDPQFIQHGGVSVSRRGGGGVGGSISVFLSIYYNNCNYMMKWAMVLTLAGALCCPLEEGRFAPRLVTKQPTVALTLLSDTGVGVSI